MDDSGNLYLSDDERIRKVTPDGIITTIAGGGVDQTRLDNNGRVESPTPATSFRLDGVLYLDVGPDGSVFFVMGAGNTVHQVTPDGMLVTIAGLPDRGFAGDGGPALEAQFNLPTGTAVDAQGNVIISDSQNKRIRKLTPTGGPVAGGGDTGGDGSDGEPADGGTGNDGTGTDGTSDGTGDNDTPAVDLPTGERGPIALDLDTTAGDQSKLQTDLNPEPGDTAPIDVVAISGAQGAIGFQVVVGYDTAQLEFVSYAPADVFAGGAPLPAVVGDGQVTANVALLGLTTSKDSGSMAVVNFKALDGFTGPTQVTLKSASYDTPVTVGTGGAFVVLGGGASVLPPTIPEDPVEASDFSGDGKVDFNDFLDFAKNFGRNTADSDFNTRIDLNQDGSVDFNDFLAFARQFGKSVGGG